MKKFSLKQKVVAGVVAVAAVAAIAVPVASASFYVSGETSDNSTGLGALAVHVTLDQSADNGGVYTKWVYIPNGGTVEDVLSEMITSSNSQEGLDAIHNYDYESIKSEVEGGKYEVKVYNAETQNPGTQTTHDTDGTTVTDYGSTTLQRFDNVVITLQK